MSARQQRLAESPWTTLYHATNCDAARSIMRDEGLMPGRGGKLGPAVYFAETPEDARRKSQNGKEVVLEVHVELGNTLFVSAEEDFDYGWLAKRGYDSVCLDERGSTGSVWAVFVPRDRRFSDQIRSISWFLGHQLAAAPAASSWSAPQQHECDICCREFGSQRALDQHAAATGHDRVCRFCPKSFHTVQGRIQHERDVH